MTSQFLVIEFEQAGAVASELGHGLRAVRREGDEKVSTRKPT
jgi:hypothetical protein